MRTRELERASKRGRHIVIALFVFVMMTALAILSVLAPSCPGLLETCFVKGRVTV